MMETKKIVESLRSCAEKLGCHRYIIGNCAENISFGKVLDEAAERLEELEAELGKRTINDRPYEWISVEERLPGAYGRYISYNGEDIKIRTFDPVRQGSWIIGEVTHWMPLPEPPKPKEPTFKDVFLKAFPKAELHNEDGDTPICRVAVFGYGECNYESCAHCWNQPYFEEEGEAE